MPKDIIEGRIVSDTVARVSAKHVERLSRHKLRSGDIVYGRRGDIGRQALIRPEQAGWMCGTGCLRLSLGDKVLDPLFLHYYLRQDDVVDWITNQAVGATMPNLNTGILRSVPVKFPPLPIQQRIAGILSAYDELIENSQRRIKILEAMARALYREWFVYFRFPGHDNHPRVASPLGEIPQGWEVKKLGDISSYINRGITPRYDEEGDSVVINQKCVRDQRLSLEPARRQSKAIPSEKQVCFGDVLINSTGVGTDNLSVVPHRFTPETP